MELRCFGIVSTRFSTKLTPPGSKVDRSLRLMFTITYQFLDVSKHRLLNFRPRTRMDKKNKKNHTQQTPIEADEISHRRTFLDESSTLTGEFRGKKKKLASRIVVGI